MKFILEQNKIIERIKMRYTSRLNLRSCLANKTVDRTKFETTNKEYSSLHN